MFDTQLTTLTLACLEIVVAVTLHSFIVYLCYKYKDSMYKGIKFVWLRSPVLILICFLLSLIFHPGSPGAYYFTLQMLVSFTIFLEGVAMIPQLVHLK